MTLLSNNNPHYVNRKRHIPPPKFFYIGLLSLPMKITVVSSSSQSQRNLNRPRILPGAFNPALTSFDPNNVNYTHNDPGLTADLSISEAPADPASFGAPADWVQCPPDKRGHVASYDCTSYITCQDGEMVGGYESCMGLLFDNVKGVCDWEESVSCGGEGIGTEVDGNGTTYDGARESSTEFRPMGGSFPAESSVTDDKENHASWNGGSDWGGSWVEGVWVPEGLEEPSSLDKEPASDNVWIDQSWDTASIKSFPPRPLSKVDQYLASSKGTKPPREFKSEEGWSSSTRKEKTVVGYYASWKWYDNSERSAPSNIKFQKVDRVNYAFFQTNTDGDIWGTDPWADPILLFGPTDWVINLPPEFDYAPQFNDDNGFVDTTGDNYNYVGSKYVDLGPNVYCHRTSPKGKRDCKGHLGAQGLIEHAQSQGARVYVSIGGWSLSDAFPKVAGDAKARRNFAKNCVGLIREYGFDGIDIDWEYPGYVPHQGTSSDKENFVLLLKEIRAALDAYQSAVYPNGEKMFGITAALPCIPPIIESQAISQLSAVLTEMNLISFDFHGPWDDRVGVNAPLYDQDPREFDSPGSSLDGCVERWIKEGADSEKILISLPFFGRSFGGSKKLYSGHSGKDEIHWWSDQGRPQYYNILEQLPDMISLRDNVTMTQFAYFDDDKGGLVSYDDNQAICDKVEYAQKKDLRGYLIWELSGDLTEDLATPLLDVVNIKLEQGDGFDCSLLRAETRDDSGNVVSQESSKDNPWYAHWETGTCINDGKQSSWEKEENLFRFKEECCGYKFEYKFEECVGPSSIPTYSPSVSPIYTVTTTDNPTHVFGGAKVILPASDFERDISGNSGTPTAMSTRIAQETSPEDGPAPPVTWCKGGCPNPSDECVGNQNNPQAIDDETCKSCLDGQTFWPCDVDGLCFCWDPSLPRIPPAPASGLAQLSEERPCDYFTEDLFNQLGPNATFPYTYEGLCLAIDHYNDGHAEKIFMMGSDEEKKKEFASFLGNTLHESDEWKAGREYLMCADNKQVEDETWCKPCTTDEFDWETFKCTGVGLAGGGLSFNGYCDSVIQPPAACPCNDTIIGDVDGYIQASDVFFGRGAIQLSWNYNFRAASEALTSDPQTFCDDPDLVALTPEYAWGAGIFFWMENLKEETTCHIEALRNHDFGGTLNNVNGGLECPAYHGGWHGEAIKMRLNRYCRATAVLGLESVLTLDGCKGLNASFAECLGDGTCPDCEPFSDGTEPLVNPELTSPSESEAGNSTSISDSVSHSTGPTPSPEYFNATEVSSPEEGSSTSMLSAPSLSTAPSLSPENSSSTVLLSSDEESNSTSAPTSPSLSTSPSPSLGNFNSTDAPASEVGSLTSAPGALSNNMSTPHINSSEAPASEISSLTSAPSNLSNMTTSDPSPGHPKNATEVEVPSQIDAEAVVSAAPTSRTLSEEPSQAPSVSRTLAPIQSKAEKTESPSRLKSEKTQTPSNAKSDKTPVADELAEEITTDTSSGCAEGLFPVDGLPGCCLPEAAYLGDGACDPEAPYNSPECNFDNGDCCKETCDLGSTYGCSNAESFGYGPFGYFCLNSDLKEYVNPTECTVSDRTRLGDGRCDSGDDMYNTAECQWDGGDCCEQTCDPRYAYFECGDPSHPYDCKNTEYTSSLPMVGSVSSTTPALLDPSTTEASITSSSAPLVNDPLDGSTTGSLGGSSSTTSSLITTSAKTSTTSSSSDSPPLPTEKVTVTASDDATLMKNNPDGNYGSNSTLQLKGGSSSPNSQDVILRFILPKSESAPLSAVLRIYALSDSNSGGIFHSAPESSPWSEKTVTWNTAPDYLDRLGKLGSVEKNKWYEIDIIDQVKELFGRRNPLSIRVQSRNPYYTEFSSREGAHPPEVVISYSSKDEVVATDPNPINQASHAVENDLQDSATMYIVSITADEFSEHRSGKYFYPTWGKGGAISCSKGPPPNWATGAYLKKSKAECCDAYFMLQVDECLSS